MAAAEPRPARAGGAKKATGAGGMKKATGAGGTKKAAGAGGARKAAATGGAKKAAGTRGAKAPAAPPRKRSAAKPGKPPGQAALRRAEAERQALLALPPVRWRDLIALVPGTGATRLLARAAGALAVVAAVLLLLSDLTPYLVLTGTGVRAPLDALGVVARVLVAAGLVAPGVLLVLGRGGRATLGLLLPFGLTAVGTAVAVYAEADSGARPATQDYIGREFFFGRAYSTDTIEAASGHYLALAGDVVLVVVLVLVVLAWPGDGRDDRVPLGAARLPAAGFGVTAGLLGAVAFCLAPAAGVVRTTTAADGITEVPLSVLTPPSTFGLSGLALAGGLLLATGVLVAGTASGAMSSRAARVGTLGGLALYLTAATLTNLSDIVRNDDLVAGLSTYALVAAAVVAAVGVGYVARVRRGGEDVLGSDEESRLGVPADELV